MSNKRSYLKRLPEEAQARGNAGEGEVEIVTSARELKKTAKECPDELTGSALGKNGKRIGILLDDHMHLIVRDAVRFPGGATNYRMRIIGKTEYDGPNGVAILGMTAGQFVLREIYRHATRSWELEIPRGRREAGQTPRQAVRAEVKQELGYSVKKMRLLGMVRPDSAIMSSHLEIFFAELGAAGKPEPEETEAFGEIVKLTPEELGHRIVSGFVRDSYTMAALLLAQLKGLIPPVTLAP